VTFLLIVRLLDSKIDLITGNTCVPSQLTYTSFINRYLKKLFRDLFERENFVDDGIFDWDIIKKQQHEAQLPRGAGSAADDIQPDPVKDPGGAVEPPATGAKASARVENNGSASPARGVSAAAGGASSARVGAPVEDSSMDALRNDLSSSAQPHRRSFISSIR